jgi:hypothetical protein
MTERLSFEIYWDDLTVEAQDRFLEEVGHEVLVDELDEPLAIIMFEEEE